MAILSLVLVAWAALAGGFTAVTLWACARLASRIAERPAPTRLPPLWVLRPCEGDEPGLLENLASTLVPYGGPLRVTILVPSEQDLAWPAACRVAESAPGVVEVLATRITSTKNRKAAQLAVGLEHVLSAPRRPEVLVQIDSDVRLRAGTLTALVAALEDDERVAAAFAAPVDLGARTVGDAAAGGLLTASHQDFFAVAALAAMHDGPPSLAGGLAAHRLGPLVETGGFASLEPLLGEDWEVGKRLHARGLRIAMAALPAVCVEEGRSFRAVLARAARWIMVVRRQRPALMPTYPLLLAPTPLIVLGAIVLAVLGHPLPLAFAIALVLLRGGLALVLREIHGEPVGIAGALWLSMLAEVLMLLAAARALLARDVVWRGRRLRIGPGGAIE